MTITNSHSTCNFEFSWYTPFFFKGLAPTSLLTSCYFDQSLLIYIIDDALEASDHLAEEREALLSREKVEWNHTEGPLFRCKKQRGADV